MRGHGRSGMPDNAEAYSSDHFAEDFYAVMEGFHLKKPFLAGWYVFSRASWCPAD